MRVLIVGGTGFIGSYVTSLLVAYGHQVALLNRGISRSARKIPESVVLIRGDKTELAACRDQIADFRPDVTVHMVCYSDDDASQFITTLKGITSSLTVISSSDVYRAFGILHRTESGPIEPDALTEDSPLRRQLSIHGEKNEKRFVEKVALESSIPSTIMRLPAVYGPGDPAGRWYPFLKRMRDRRSLIILGERQAQWRFPSGYVENVAHAIYLAVSKPSTEDRVFNVGEERTLTVKEFVEKLARNLGWKGDVCLVPDTALPEHLKSPGDCEQSLVLDTSRIRTDLGFTEVVDDESAARKSINWYLENPPARMGYGRLLYDVEDQMIEQSEFLPVGKPHKELHNNPYPSSSHRDL